MNELNTFNLVPLLRKVGMAMCSSNKLRLALCITLFAITVFGETPKTGDHQAKKADSQPEDPRNHFWESLIQDDKEGLKIKVSQTILDQLAKLYGKSKSPQNPSEDIFLLFANQNTGVIEKITKKYTFCGAEYCGIEAGFDKYVEEIARREGYFLVGWYHSHPSLRDQTGNFAREEIDLLSDEDIRNHFDSANMVDFLQHGSDRFKIQPRIRAFTVLREHDEEPNGMRRPYDRRRKEFENRNLFAKSAYSGGIQRNVLELKVIPLKSEVDPSFDPILGRYPEFMKEFNESISAKTFSEIIPLKRVLTFKGIGSKKYPPTDIETRNFNLKIKQGGRMEMQIELKEKGDSFPTEISLMLVEGKVSAETKYNGYAVGILYGKHREALERLLQTLRETTSSTVSEKIGVFQEHLRIQKQK